MSRHIKAYWDGSDYVFPKYVDLVDFYKNKKVNLNIYRVELRVPEETATETTIPITCEQKSDIMVEILNNPNRAKFLGKFINK